MFTTLSASLPPISDSNVPKRFFFSFIGSAIVTILFFLLPSPFVSPNGLYSHISFTKPSSDSTGVNFAAATASSRAASVLNRLRRPVLSAWVRSHLRLTMETHPWPTGGPEGCAQMVDALRVLGVPASSLTLTEDVTAVFDRYTHGFSVWQGPESLTPGSVTVTTEWAPCKLPHARGIKQLGYELSILLGKEQLVDPEKLHCLWFGHSYYTRQYVDGPSRAIVRQYFSDVYSKDTPTTLAQASSLKRNLVIIDGDFEGGGGGACCTGGGHAAALRKALAAAGFLDAEVVVLEGFTSAQVRDLFKQAKVIVDGHLHGMERANQEATLSWVAPVPEQWANGACKVDYPLPTSQLGFTSEEEMHARVISVLSNYSAAAIAASPARVWNGAQKKINRFDVARMFESVGLAVHVTVCGESKEVPASARLASALLVAAAVHLTAPMASVVLHVEGGEGHNGPCGASHSLTAACARVSAGGGLFQHTSVLFSSPLCSAAASAGDAGSAQVSTVAYESAPYGPSEHIALLSWRALPLEAAALSSWQGSTRSSPPSQTPEESVVGEDGGPGGVVTCGASQLVVQSIGEGSAVPLGALLDGEKNTSLVHVAVDLDGGKVIVPSHTCSFLSGNEAGAQHGPVFLDMIASGVLMGSNTPPGDSNCGLLGDESVLDMYVALTEEGIWDTIASDMAPYIQTCALGGQGVAPKPVTQHLCASQRFNALAVELELLTLCVGTSG